MHCQQHGPGATGRPMAPRHPAGQTLGVERAAIRSAAGRGEGNRSSGLRPGRVLQVVADGRLGRLVGDEGPAVGNPGQVPRSRGSRAVRAVLSPRRGAPPMGQLPCRRKPRPRRRAPSVFVSEDLELPHRGGRSVGLGHEVLMIWLRRPRCLMAANGGVAFVERSSRGRLPWRRRRKFLRDPRTSRAVGVWHFLTTDTV